MDKGQAGVQVGNRLNLRNTFPLQSLNENSTPNNRTVVGLTPLIIGISMSYVVNSAPVSAPSIFASTLDAIAIAVRLPLMLRVVGRLPFPMWYFTL